MLSRQDSTVTFGDNELNTTSRSVTTRDGSTVQLTETEMEVLLDILEGNGDVVKRETFTPWRDKNTNPDRHPVDNHISALQAKLGAELITAVQGIGYRLSPGITVKAHSNVPVSEAELLTSAAEEHFSAHTGLDILATIGNCENKIRMGQADASTYVKLALAYMNAGHDGFCLKKRGEAFSLAKAAIVRALELNDRLSSAYALRGLAHFSDYAWQKSTDDFETALDLNPNEPSAHTLYAHLLVCQHDGEHAVEHVSYAVQLRGKDRMTLSTEPWIYTLAGRSAEAIQKALYALSVFPAFSPLHVVLGWAYQAEGYVQDAVAQYQVALQREFAAAPFASLGNAQARLGNIAEAHDALRTLRSAPKDHGLAYVSAYNRALILAGYRQSRKEQCLKALEQSFEQKNVWLPYAVVDQRFAWLRTDKRFMNLARRMGLSIQI